MRPRKWVIVLGLCVLAFFSALYQISKYLEKNRNLENLLIQGISPYIKGTFDVRRVRFGFFSAHLKDIILILPGQSVSIRIRDIKVGFSFSRLLKFRGDISRSMNKIILNSPTIDFFLDSQAMQQEKVVFPAALNSPQAAVVVPDELPIKNLIVKRGLLRLCQDDGDTVVIGEQLRGKLTDLGNETSVNLSGKLGSVKDNLFIQGSISWTGEKNRLSLRLNGAGIKKPVSFGNLKIISGALSGTVEFEFPEKISLASLESDGWARIEDGTCRLGDKEQLLHSVQMRMTMDGSKWRVDTLSCSYLGMRVEMRGHWDISRDPSSHFEYRCAGINADSVSSFLLPELRGNVTGEGWCEGIISGDAENRLRVNFSGGGISAWGIPVVSILAYMRVDTSGVDVDSAALLSPGIVVLADGLVETGGKTPQYSARVRATLDSVPSFSGLDGRLRVSGELRGAEKLTKVQFVVSGKNVKYNNLSLGDLDLLVKSKGDLIHISTLNSDERGMDLSGSIRDLFGKSPSASISAELRKDQIFSLFERKPGMYRPDSVRVAVNAEGWIDTFRVDFDADIRDSVLSGAIAGKLGKSREEGSPVVWSLYGKNLTLKNVKAPLYIGGRLYGDSVMIDSLSALSGVRGNGKLSLNSDPFQIESSLWYDFQISRLLSMLPELGLRIEKGRLSGFSRISGNLQKPVVRSELHVRELEAGTFSGLQSDAILTFSNGNISVLPFVVRKDKQIIAAFDTISHSGGKISFTGEFDDIDVKSLLGTFKPRDLDLESRISGRIRTSPSGFPFILDFFTPSLRINNWKFDSLSFTGSITHSGLHIERLRADEGKRISIAAAGFVPWSMLGEETSDGDTLRASVDVTGNLLECIEKNVDSPIGGEGRGEAKVEFYGVPGHWVFTSGNVSVPAGKLTLRPFVPDDIKDFSFSMKVDSFSRVHTSIKGNIRRRPVRIFSSHDIPRGYESFQIGPLDFGVIQVETPKNGIHIHLPGFMALGEIGDIEFRGRRPFNKFTLSGPVDKLRITGTWILRDLEFTFPFLNTNEMPWDFDPFPYVTWEMDLRPGNRKVMYFWDLAGKKRRIMRFVEGYLDPSSVIRVRGRDLDKTFRLYGTIRSFKGSAYYGKVFDRNFDVGVEFVPQKLKDGGSYDNMPILWGSAEAFSDSSRFDRIKLTCLVHDPLTNGVSERGRLIEGKQLNISFHLSSDFEELPGESERDFYREAGLNFTTLGKAGGMVSSFGEQYFHRYLLQRWERWLARSVGLDVINIESSIASNYFNKLYNRQFDGLLGQDDYLALANVGITVGRYFFRDFLFLKARGELIPIDTVLTPEYSIGLEFQPGRYLTMDFNYGIRKGETQIEHNPRLNMQLMLPITRLRKILNF
ncbi:MAG: hypothetical protein GX089_02960 [Fibrobacter sp.]|jgi:hypothetical protein|nr:hypothetical protein [Fibrobacter sp.]